MGEILRELMLRDMERQDFPGRTALLEWLQENPDARLLRADIPIEKFTRAADARKIWEIRLRTTQQGGASSAHMDEGVQALREAEADDPDAPVVLVHARGPDRIWLILSIRDRPICAFWIGGQHIRTAP